MNDDKSILRNDFVSAERVSGEVVRQRILISTPAARSKNKCTEIVCI